MKTVLLWALIALVPFSTIRVVCLTTHASEALSAAPAAEDAAAAECSRICTHRPEAKTPPPPEPAMKCLLTVDPGCELLSMHVFVLPVQPAVVRADGVTTLGAPAMLVAASAEQPLPAPPPKSPGSRISIQG